jgi:hypothetical protein
MSKKKDFKGLTSSIVSNKVTSIDDFLGTGEGTEKPAATPVSLSSGEKSQPASKPESKTQKKATEMPDEPEKTRVSLFMASMISYELDELKMKIRRHAPRSEMSKISKSSIVEAAVEMVKADFEANGMDCELVKRILK